MRVGKVSAVLVSFSLAQCLSVRAQGLAEYGAVSASSAALAGSAARSQGAVGGAVGGAFGSVINQLNGVSGGGVAAGKHNAAPVMNGMDKDGNYDPSLAAKQAVAYSNKLFSQAQQKEKAGNLKEAEQLYRQSLGYRENIWGTSDPNVVKLYGIIGGLSQKRGALGEAERCYRIVLMSVISAYGQGSYESVPILSKLGVVYNQEKKYGDAAKEYDQIYKLEERKNGAQDRKTVEAALNLAKTYLQAPETVADAADVMRGLVDVLDKGNDSSNPLLVPVLDTYATALRKQDKGDLADKVQARSDGLRKATAVSSSPAANDATASSADAGANRKDGAASAAASKGGAAKDAKDAATKDGAAKDAGSKDGEAKDTGKTSVKDTGAKDANAKDSASAL